jgi:hypothetical protein
LNGGGTDHCKYTLMKRWTTGEKAMLEEKDTQMEIFKLAHDWMNASLLFKLNGDIDGQNDIAL